MWTPCVLSRLVTYQLPSDKMLEVSQLRAFLKQLKKQQGSIANQLHALEFHVSPLAYVVESLGKSLAFCQSQEVELLQRANSSQLRPDRQMVRYLPAQL